MRVDGDAGRQPMSHAVSLDGPDPAARVRRAMDKAATPGYAVPIAVDAVDIEAWNHVGDPLCEAVFAELRERKMLSGNVYDNARRLQRLGSDAADRFFADVETVPEWVDFDFLRIGAEMGRRNPIGMLFGMHGGLPFTYIDPATAEVMGSTGRFARGGDYRRRYWETATGFVGALDVDGMRPGGDRWQAWIRIRFLHTMIRTGIRRAGQWDMTRSMPISQVATAAATHIFGPYRVNIIEYFGGVVSQEERDSFSLMWRWISRIEGANTELLGRTHAEQLAISRRMHQYLYAPSDDSRALTRDLIRGSAAMRVFGMPERMHAAVVRDLMSESMLQTLPGRDVAADLGLSRDLLAEAPLRAVRTVLGGVNQAQRLPLVRRLAAGRGQELLDHVVDAGLDHRAADYRGTAVAGKPTDR